MLFAYTRHIATSRAPHAPPSPPQKKMRRYETCRIVTVTALGKERASGRDLNIFRLPYPYPAMPRCMRPANFLTVCSQTSFLSMLGLRSFCMSSLFRFMLPRSGSLFKWCGNNVARQNSVSRCRCTLWLPLLHRHFRLLNGRWCRFRAICLIFSVCFFIFPPDGRSRDSACSQSLI